MSENILSLDGIVKSHGRTRVLRGITLDVPRGQFVLLMGGSGSGKTTLIRLVAGLERPDAGRVTLRGRRVDSHAEGVFVPPERRGLGTVSYTHLTLPTKA